MAKKQTYGQRMAEWEEERDKRYWERAFSMVLETKDYNRIEALIIEGINSDYSFPSISDEKVLDLIKKHKL